MGTKGYNTQNTQKAISYQSKKQIPISKRLLLELEGLPLSKIEEVFDFAGYLKSMEKKKEIQKSAAELTPENDPILKFIGGVSHGSLAKDIDKDLYGG